MTKIDKTINPEKSTDYKRMSSGKLEEITRKPSIYSPEEWEAIFRNFEDASREIRREAESRELESKRYWEKYGEEIDANLKKSREKIRMQIEKEWEERKRIDQFLKEHSEEIDQNIIKKTITDLNQDLNDCKSFFRTDSPFVYSTTLRRLKNLTYHVECLIKKSKNLPTLPECYHEQIRELDQGIIASFRDFIEKAGMNANKGEIDSQDITSYKRLEQEAKSFITRFYSKDPVETFINRV